MSDPEYLRKWRADYDRKNAAKIAARRKRWQAENPEKHKAGRARHRKKSKQKNPDKWRAAKRMWMRRKRLIAANYFVSGQLPKEMSECQKLNLMGMVMQKFRGKLARGEVWDLPQKVFTPAHNSRRSKVRSSATS